MKRTVLACLLAALLLLAGCASDVWGAENLLSVSKAQGTAFSDAAGHFTMTAPEGFADVTATDADKSDLMLDNGMVAVRVTVRDYVQNLAVTSQEEYEKEYANLGMQLMSYTRGKIFGVNGLKITGSYKDASGRAMQQLQYAFNQDGSFVVFTCNYPTESAREAKKLLNSVLGSFALQGA